MSKFIAFLNAHKTKIVGGLLVLAGAMQANASSIQQLVSPKEFAWFTVGIGCVVGLLGFINSSQANQ